MKKDLERILKEKRLKLDIEEPENDLIWEGIRSGVNQKRHVPVWMWKVAAIFIFVVSATYYIVNETSNKQVVIYTLSDISGDLGEQEKALNQQVNLKWEQVQTQLTNNNDEVQFLLEQMNELDAVYQSYQQDLNRTLDNEPVVRAMLDYYEKKIKILNRILLEIEKQENYEETTSL